MNTAQLVFFREVVHSESFETFKFSDDLYFHVLEIFPFVDLFCTEELLKIFNWISCSMWLTN